MSVRSFVTRRRGVVGFVAGAATCALVLGATAAVASIPSSTAATYTACLNKTSGATRIIDFQAGKRCASTERTVSWSKGYRYRTTWSPATAYAAQDVVVYNGSSYVARIASTGKTPTQTTYWGLLAAKGATGATGATGPTGPPGETFDDRRATGTPPTSSIFFGANLISAVSNGAGGCSLRFENYSGVSIELLVETEGSAARSTVAHVTTPTITSVLTGPHLTRFRAKEGSVSYTGDVWWFPADATTCTIDGHVITGSY